MINYPTTVNFLLIFCPVLRSELYLFSLGNIAVAITVRTNVKAQTINI